MQITENTATRRKFLAICVILSMFAAAPSRAFWWGPRADSRWLDRTITVDGRDDDWQAQPAEDAEGLSFAFANDAKNLYIMLAPHTKSIKQQMAGAYEQDFSIWIDTGTGKGKNMAFKLLAPAAFGETIEREMETVGIETAAVAMNGEAEMRMGATDERGVLEARIPLNYFGTPVPKIISVGFETSAPRKPPPSRTGKPRSARGNPTEDESGQEGFGRGGRGRRGGAGGRHGAAGANEEAFNSVGIWIRVTLAAAARR